MSRGVPTPSPAPSAEPGVGRWRTVGSLRNRNYRRYLGGHTLSHHGLWIQQTAELWLILQLTGSGSALALHAVLRSGPVLVLGAYGGLLSDRLDRWRLLIGTQTVHAVSAGVIAAAVWTGRPSLTLIYTVVLAQGLVNAVDNPLRRAFVRDLVTDDELANAVSLNSSVGTIARAVGPAVAGLLIAGVGVAWCFTINAISYVGTLGALALLDRRRLRPQDVVRRAPGQLRAGFAYAWRHATIRRTLILCLVVSVFGWNWAVLVPFYATEEFGAGASLYGVSLSLLGVGSLVGALMTARLVRISGRRLLVASAALSGALLFTSLAPVFVVGVVGLFLVGAAGTSVTIGTQTRVQLAVDDAMSGRVLALYSVIFIGSKPIGGAIGGWVVDQAGSRTAFAVNAAAIALAVVVFWLTSRRRGGTEPAARAPSPRVPDVAVPRST